MLKVAVPWCFSLQFGSVTWVTPLPSRVFFFFLKRPPKPSTLNVFLPAPPHSSALISVKTVSRCSANHLLGRGVSIPVYSKNQDASLLDLFHHLRTSDRDVWCMHPLKKTRCGIKKHLVWSQYQPDYLTSHLCQLGVQQGSLCVKSPLIMKDILLLLLLFSDLSQFPLLLFSLSVA